MFCDAVAVYFAGGGFSAIFLTLIFFSLNKDQNSQTGTYGKWKALALLAFISSGLLETFNNLPSYFPASESLSSVWRAAATDLGAAIGSFGLMLRHKDFRREFAKNGACPRLWKYCILLNIMPLFVAFFLIYPGMDILARHHAGAIAYPLMMGACLIGFELYCRVILHEKRTAAQWIWMTICLLRVFALSL